MLKSQNVSGVFSPPKAVDQLALVTCRPQQQGDGVVGRDIVVTTSASLSNIPLAIKKTTSIVMTQRTGEPRKLVD